MSFRVQPDIDDDPAGVLSETFFEHDQALRRAEQLLAQGVFRTVTISEDAPGAA